MHASIMSFPSLAMYDSLLIAAPSVASRLLTTLPYAVEDTDDTREPLIFYDTQGGDFPESAPPDESGGADGNGKAPTKGSLLNDSKSNPSEALLVKKHVRSLIEAGVKGEDIAVITPYNAQLSYLVNELGFKEAFEDVELGSVDGFQGREKEVVVVCLVRSNERGEVGFLRESRRLNVAMTRARRQLCVVGDGETVGK
jgi:DNA polymerase alpha-associated DNA helicase A